MNLTNLIKSKALELGFQKVGISSPEVPLKNTKYYDEWLKSGKNGTMKWLDNRKEERKDIYKYFPDIKSVVSVAINYFPGISNDIVVNGNRSIKISNYARGTDYHIIVKQKLSQLLDCIKNNSTQNTKGLICVDTSPVMDKQWAQSAGIGWQGKHTILINEEYGSWLFLGELLLDIPLEYDVPFEIDLCSSCTACIDACPTNALAEYQLDATKCISYLTVEFKEEFDSSQKDKLNGWAYGCDICQQVCPWNKKRQQYSNEKAFHTIREVQKYSITDWIDLDKKSFKKIFKYSSIGRIGYDRFMRNITANEKKHSIDRKFIKQ